MELHRTLGSLAVLGLTLGALAWTAVREGQVRALRAERDALREELAATHRALGVTHLEREIDASIEHLRWLATRPVTQQTIDASRATEERLREHVAQAARTPWLRHRLRDWDAWAGAGALGRLQRFVSEGNRALRALLEAIQRQDWTDAEEAHATIERVAAEMRLEERDVYHRNGRALRLRADQLARGQKELRHLACCAEVAPVATR